PTSTFTCDGRSAVLTFDLIVVNNSGGTSVATDFSFKVNNGSATSFLADPDANPLHGLNSLTVNAGTYTVTEPAVTGYDTSYSNCTDVLIANGGTATCTITNDDQAATLIVKKIVVNNSGGTSVATDFSFKVNNGSATSFLQDPDANPLHGLNSLTVNAGTYTVTEPARTDYDTSDTNCTR